MVRLDLPWIIDVCAALDQLDMVKAGESIDNVFFLLFNAKRSVEAAFQQSVYSQHLRISRRKADILVSSIQDLSNRFRGDSPQYELTEFDAWTIANNRDRFREVFLSEISTLPAYLVTRKEGYDIETLTDAGAALFPSNLLKKAPETEKDALEAGRCLAFEVATACGFHTFRVTESVIKRYWDEASSGASRPNLQTLGNFASEMEKQNYGDPRITESIKMMARLHRNPIIHPEYILTVEEAIGTLGMARSVIGAMLAVLPDVPPTTGASAATATP